ncbi:MAG: hypothetical protein KC656_23785, partial [Myxococcales bacterium]|nr:hypothetical protein [Myxococcales bacterium]
PGEVVVLQADPDFQPISVHWTQTTGPTAWLDGARELTLSVEPTEPGHCVFEVEVEAPSGEIVTAAAHVVVLAPAGAPRGCGCAGGSGGYGPVGLILALLVACGSRRRSLSSP